MVRISYPRNHIVFYFVCFCYLMAENFNKLKKYFPFFFFKFLKILLKNIHINVKTLNFFKKIKYKNNVYKLITFQIRKKMI